MGCRLTQPHPSNPWVWGSILTGGSQPAKLPLFGRYSLKTLDLIQKEEQQAN